MITTSVEAIIFSSAKSVKSSGLQKMLDVSEEVIREAISDIQERYNTEGSGIHLIFHDDRVQFVTNPSESELVSSVMKYEVGGELTRPQLETLTVIAYRGPITKPEIEQIRGVNCSLILRNLLIRGLIKEKTDTNHIQPVYSVSEDLLRQLGIHSISDLPQYQEYNQNEKIDKMLEELSEQEEV